MKKNVCKVTGFLLILSMILIYINNLLSFKCTDGITQMEYFYDLEKDSVDVLVLGSSHAFTNVSPELLWEEYGFSAYDLCASMQTTWNTYYYLKEALKYQKPQLIVMDVYRLVETFPYTKESKMIKSTYGMRFSREKYEAIYACLENPNVREVMMHMLEFPSYHSRYADLSQGDFKDEMIVGEEYRGFHPLENVTPMDRPMLDNITDAAVIEPKTLLYFEKILALAEEYNIPLLLINAPYIMSEDDKTVFNGLEAYLCRQNICQNVAYIDYNERYDEMGLDFSADFADYNHLNINGVTKFNKLLGADISTRYSLCAR